MTIAATVVTLLAVAATLAGAQSPNIQTAPPGVRAPGSRKAQRVFCDTRDACFPYSPRGPFCSRGNYINFRFQLQLAPEQYRRDPALPEPISNVTYAFCPKVDELMAFNISRVGELSLTWINGTIYDPYYNETYDNLTWGSREKVYLSVIGFGDTSNVAFPQEGSIGRVLIADYSMDTICVNIGEYAVVSFLSLNVSMENGRFKYPDSGGGPAGTGFVGSCDDFGVCSYNASLTCIGEPGNMNCAECIGGYGREYDLYQHKLQVWTSYYGTDARGRHFTSGSSNPLNFQAFSGSGVAGAMRRSYTNIEDGRTLGDDELTPEGRRQIEELEWDADDFMNLLHP